MVSSTGKINFMSPFAPDENLISRDGFGHPIPRQPVHGTHSGRNLVLTRGIPPTVNRYRVSPEFMGHANAYRWCLPPRVRRHKAGNPKGSSSNGCAVNSSIYSGNPMEQFLCVNFSHTHYWHIMYGHHI